MEGASNGPRILLADDEPAIVDFLERGLRALGYTVDSTADGVEAQHKALTADVDLVLLDIMLPRRDGLTALRAIRRQKPHLPVMLMTARETGEEVLAAVEHGPTAYLAKPFSFDDLISRVESLLGQKQSGTASGRGMTGQACARLR